MTNTIQRRLARALTSAVMLAVVAGIAPDRAAAGEYSVTACDPRVAAGANRSWAPEISHGGMTAYAVCPPGAQDWGQGLITRHAVVNGNSFATIPGFANAAWVFRAPPGTAIVRAGYEHTFCAGSDFHAGLFNGANQMIHGPTSGCGSLAPSPITVELGGLDALKVMTICAKSSCNVGRGFRPTRPCAR